jgi:hypothetical protein
MDLGTSFLKVLGRSKMPKGFNLRCGIGKTARAWLQGKGGALTPGNTFVLLPIKERETEESPAGYYTSLRQALVDENTENLVKNLSKIKGRVCYTLAPRRAALPAQLCRVTH